MAKAPQIGEVLLARLPQRRPSGHEQEGTRPVIVVGEPARIGTPRYPLVIVVPVASQRGAWSHQNPLYPLISVGAGGLAQASVVMLDHLGGVDAGRIMRRLGTLKAVEYEPIKSGLEAMFSLSG